MKLGILGGTFDPIHNGHMHMALAAQEEYNLDEVWLMPTGHSPHKPDENITSGKHRLAMAELAAEDYPGICVSTFETDCSERSYTFRTLQKLHEKRPSDELYFIMGADSLYYLDRWVHPEIICSLAVILAAGRDNLLEAQLSDKITQLKQLFAADIRIVHCDSIAAASREIRRRIAVGEDVSDMLPRKVEEYIRRNRLYVKEQLINTEGGA